MAVAARTARMTGAGVAAESPARRTQSARREQAEQRLLDAALRLVAERGSVHVTLADVGRAAGHSGGLATHHFGSKLGLLERLADHLQQRLHSALSGRGATALAGLDAIRERVAVYFSDGEESMATARALLVMMSDAFVPGSQLARTMAAYNRQAVQAIERDLRSGIELGQIRGDIDAADYAVMILGTLRGVLSQRLIEAPRGRLSSAELADLRRDLTQVIERMLVA